MPLHDWADDRGWSGVHHLWQTTILDWLQDRLPKDYRAYIGAVPQLSIESTNGRPDLSVRTWCPPDGQRAERAPSDGEFAPDAESVAVLELEPQTSVFVDLHGQLVAAVELVSPRNKDRPDSRERYTGRYLGYIRQSVHLLLIDVLPRPVGFSFADGIAGALHIDQPPCPVPYAVSYRVGEPVPEGTLLARWVRPLKVGEALPTIPLALNVYQAVPIDLEHTYREAARRVYLD
jgi:Protein of unknown function (DUF4058)